MAHHLPPTTHHTKSAPSAWHAPAPAFEVPVAMGTPVGAESATSSRPATPGATDAVEVAPTSPLATVAMPAMPAMAATDAVSLSAGEAMEMSPTSPLATVAMVAMPSATDVVSQVAPEAVESSPTSPLATVASPRPVAPPTSAAVSAPHAVARAMKVVLVMPAYNAARTLQQTWAEIPPGLVDEHLLCDDASRDGTPELARSLGIRVVEHAHNRGYGGNQKTCYREALASGADIVVMLHPDYQYDPRLVPMMLLPLQLGILDVMMGSRVRTRRECLESGMPLYKYLGNRALTLVENVALGQNLGEFHSGFRAYRREVLETLPFERFSDDFVFDSQFLVSAVDAGFRIGEIPVPVRYMPEASSIGFARSVRYGLGTLGAVGQYLLKRVGLPPAPIFASHAPRGANRPADRSPFTGPGDTGGARTA